MSTAKNLEVKMKTNTIETRVALLEQSINHINETLIRMEKRIESIDMNINSKFEVIDKKLDKFDGRVWTNFYWILGALFSLTGFLCGVMAKGFGWFN